MRLYVVSFGKLKTPGLREAADYYLKLTGTWLPIEEVELKPLAVPEKGTATRRLIQEQEGKILQQKLARILGPRGAFYLLDEAGIAKTTQAWAAQVRDWESNGVTEIAFCIGSSLGFSTEVRNRAKGLLSLGAQTLPHELARVVLIEQLYRSWGVVRGHPYHNEGI